MVDWSKPIEAVRKSDGLVVPMELEHVSDDMYETCAVPNSSETNRQWRVDGSDYCYQDKWFIRNVSAIDWSKPIRNTVTGDDMTAVEIAGDTVTVVLTKHKDHGSDYHFTRDRLTGEHRGDALGSSVVIENYEPVIESRNPTDQELADRIRAAVKVAQDAGLKVEITSITRSL